MHVSIWSRETTGCYFSFGKKKTDFEQVSLPKYYCQMLFKIMYYGTGGKSLVMIGGNMLVIKKM